MGLVAHSHEYISSLKDSQTMVLLGSMLDMDWDGLFPQAAYLFYVWSMAPLFMVDLLSVVHHSG